MYEEEYKKEESKLNVKIKFMGLHSYKYPNLNEK